MAMQSVTQKRLRIEIDIMRDGNFYFYNRRESGVTVVDAQRVSGARARAIVAENAADVKYQTGNVRFDEGDYRFSWTAEVWQEGDDGN